MADATTAAAPSPAPAAPAVATPAAAAPAAAPAADTGTPAAAEPLTSLASTASAEPAAAPEFKADEARAFLTEKGVKDADKLSDADLKTQFDQAKATEATDKALADIKVTIPEGVTVDEKLLTDFKGIIADANLSPSDRAQKLMDLHVNAIKAEAEAPYKLWADTQAKWQGEVKTDPELGGTNFDATRAVLAKAIDSFGKAEAQKIREALDFTGAGNNPEIIRLVARMGKALAEPAAIAGTPPAKGDLSSIASKMYPSATGSQQAS